MTVERAWLQGISPTFFVKYLIYHVAYHFLQTENLQTNLIQNTYRNLTSVNTFSIYGTYFIVQQKMHTLCHLGR